MTPTALAASSHVQVDTQAGVSSGMGTHTPVAVVSGVGGLLFPPEPLDAAVTVCVDSGTLARCPQLAPPTAAVSQFVRVHVVSEDSESDSDSEASAGVGAVPAVGYQRVAIVEEDDEEGEDDDQGTGAALPPPPPSASEELAQTKAYTEAETLKEAEALKEAGNMLMKAGQLQEAVQAYSQSLALTDGRFVPALNNRAQAHLMLQVLLHR